MNSAPETLRAVQDKLFGRRVEWSAIDPLLARARPRALELVREACLIESYFPVYASAMMGVFRDDVTATSIFAIESFEAYSHYYLLGRYLETVGFNPVTDDEILALRRKAPTAYADPIQELVNFMMTEHFAAHFFRDVTELTDEPVLQRLLQQLAAEEVVHSQFAFDLLRIRLDRQPALKSAILRSARQYRHVGSYVLPSVSNAKADNVKTITAFNRRVEALVGERLSDAIVTGETP